MPRVRVRWFAVLRERRGREVEEIDARPGSTLRELYRELVPPGPEGALPVAYARNQAYASPDEVVAEGDEIAFLPPIGGG